MSDVQFGAAASSANEEAPSSTIGDDIDALRRELEEARPRLAAFAALEEMAEAQGSTPEAIALQASIEMLESSEAEQRAVVDELTEQRDALRAEIAEAESEHSAVVDEVAEMIEELESIRADGVRLLGEKAKLEMKIEALRNESDGIVVDRRRDTAGIIDDADEATAFDAFFEADVVEDKARAWMLE